VFVAAGGAAGVASLGGAFTGGAEAVAVVFGCPILRGAGFGADCALGAGFGLGAAGFGAGFGIGFGAVCGAGDWAAGAGFCALLS
jgi:hypothetical protein